MSVEKITEKLDSIEAQQAAKIEEAKTEVTKLVDEKVATFEEKVAALEDRKSTRLNSSHSQQSRMPSSA